MNLGNYTHKKADDLPEMDPMLQNMLLRNKSGSKINPYQVVASHEWGYEIDIILQLNDPAGEVPDQIKVSFRIENNPVVTGTTSFQELKDISQHENVKTLEAPRPITKSLARSVRDIDADLPKN